MITSLQQFLLENIIKRIRISQIPSSSKPAPLVDVACASMVLLLAKGHRKTTCWDQLCCSTLLDLLRSNKEHIFLFLEIYAYANMYTCKIYAREQNANI